MEHQQLQQEIKFTVTGNGKAILLIHGFGFTGASWSHIEKGLSTEYKIIIPTLPGFDGNPLVEDISIPSLADALIHLLHKEAIDEVVIIGHSMGGYIGLEMAGKISHIKKGIGLIHSHPFADDPSKIKNRRKGINFIKKYGSYRYAKETIPFLLDDAFRKENPEQVQELIQIAGAVSEATISTYLEAMISRRDTSEILEKIDEPVLFVLGEEDNSLPLNQGLEQVTLPSAAILKILFGIGHLGIIEAPAAVEDAIRDYLKLIKY